MSLARKVVSAFSSASGVDARRLTEEQVRKTLRDLRKEMSNRSIQSRSQIELFLVHEVFSGASNVSIRYRDLLSSEDYYVLGAAPDTCIVCVATHKSSESDIPNIRLLITMSR